MFRHRSCIISPILIPPSYIANRKMFRTSHLSVFSLIGSLMSLASSASRNPVMAGGISFTVISFLGISSVCIIPSSTALLSIARRTFMCFAMEFGESVEPGFLLFGRVLKYEVRLVIKAGVISLKSMSFTPRERT